MTVFTGTSADNVFTGGANTDTATGAGGNDTLNGGGGNDSLSGGTGSDRLLGGAGEDLLFGGEPSVFYVSANPDLPPLVPMIFDTRAEVDTLEGGVGDDTISAGYGDNIHGGDGGDFLYISLQGATTGVTVDFNADTVVIGGGVITGIEAVGWIRGSDFADVITDLEGQGGYGAIMEGLGGDDRLFARHSTNQMWGGDGDDLVDGRGSVYLSRVTGDAGDDILYAGGSLSVADGGDGDDVIYSSGRTHGGRGDDLIHMSMSGLFFPDIYGDDGDDIIVGASSLVGVTSISGGRGADHVIGGTRGDILFSGGATGLETRAQTDDVRLDHDVIEGLAGDDVIWAGYGDDVDGGAHIDTLHLSFGGATSGVTFDTTALAEGRSFTFGGGTIINIEVLEDLTGSAFNDIITVGSHGQQVIIFGGAGDDLIMASDSPVLASGGDGNDRFVSGSNEDKVWLGAGVNTVDYSNAMAGMGVRLDTGNGYGHSTDGDSLMYVQNVIGSAFADTVEGDVDANWLRGMAGADILDGKYGADVLEGGAGDDTYYIGDVGDVVTEAANAGNDLVYSSASFAMGANIETLTLTGSAAINGTGNASSNRITGNSAANVIDGGRGADVMIGGAGDDTYYVDTVHDVITEGDAPGDGVDRVFSSTTYVLAANVETLTLTGSAAINGTGNASANRITGNAAANTLSGGSGSDVLNGGAGDDILIGGLGWDVYLIDSAGDRVVESASSNGGTDRVESGVSFALGDFMENLVLTGSASTRGTGNSLTNILVGNEGANILDGRSGADIMQGGAGSDTYVVDNAGDVVTESAAAEGGVDLVNSSVRFVLGDHVENLTLTGTADINGGGNALANALMGNAGNNTLNGLGGADLMQGREGDDVYIVDNINDRVVEGSFRWGADTVRSGVSYTLTSNVETLILTGGAVIDGTGNTGVNVLVGNGRANILTGGQGADVLTGGAGVDTFNFASTADSTVAAFDRITDLTSQDRIDISTIDANINRSGNQGFAIVNAFSNVAGQMTLDYSSGTGLTTILMDVNGDGVADMKIVAKGDHHDFGGFVL